MKKAAFIVLAHLVGFALLICVGLHFNDAISRRYAGLVVVFSVAWGVYATLLNVLYQRSYVFHLFINRLRLKLARTHTFWEPHFHFTLDNDKARNMRLLDNLWELVQRGDYGRAVKKDMTPTTLTVALDNLLVVKFRTSDGSLSISFEQKLLVPSHLYDDYRRRLARLAEGIAGAVHPSATAFGIQVSFEDGVRNPYYGFFVNRVPASLLQEFQVTFRLDPWSDCRIEVGTDHVNIESASLADTFEALNQVLRLRALPKGMPT